MENNQCERFPSEAVDTSKEFYADKKFIKEVADLKSFLDKNDDQNYAIPAFIDGENKSITVLKFKKKKKMLTNMMTLINPTLLSTSGFILSEETQYGVEGVYLVPRHPKVEVMYVSLPKGDPIRQTLIGMSALVFQQALQALSGIYINDIGLRIDDNDEYQSADQEGKVKIAELYLKALKEISEEVAETDEDIKTYISATDFIAEKIQVSTKVEEALTNGQGFTEVSNDLQPVGKTGE